MSNTRWNLHKAAAGDQKIAGEGLLVAEIGSLKSEITRLAQITRDPKWYDAVAMIMDVFDQQKDMSNVP